MRLPASDYIYNINKLVVPDVERIVEDTKNMHRQVFTQMLEHGYFDKKDNEEDNF